MKRILASICLVLASVVVFGQTFEKVAPEDNNRDENGKISRSGYITNEWYDNWSIAVAGGAQTMISGFPNNNNRGFDPGTAVFTPALDVSLTKWVTPATAIRLGFQGLNLREDFDAYNWNHYVVKSIDGRNYYGQTYLHADILWSLTNFVWGYKESRFYNATPYFHAGYLRLYHPDEGIFTNVYRDREFELGFGLINTLRVSKHIGINVDLRWGNFAGRYHDASNGGRVNHFTALAGVSYTFHKWYWNRYSTAVKGYESALDAERALRDASDRKLAQAEKELADARKALADAQDAIAKRAADEAARRPGIQDELLRRIANAELVLFYPINVDKLSAQELYRLDNYVKVVREQDPGHVFYITGSADKGTGNERINTRLSQNRAVSVKKLLMSKYGIPESQIVIKAMIITDRHADGSLDRCTIFESE